MIVASPSEWFSPVLVKEMRQGLKSRAFVAVFLVQHAVLLLGFTIPLVTESPSSIAEATGFFFWLVAVVSLVVLTPLAGMNAIAQERREHTLELVLLTRLTAWRVVFGKWTSLLAQTALLASGLLPYLVVRYYLGGVNLVLEALTLIALVLMSGVLTAVSVLASTYGFALARLLVLAMQGGLGLTALGLLANVTRRGAGGMGLTPSGASTWEIVGAVALVLLVLALIVYFLLQVAATRIAPPAENHAATKRLTGFALLLLPLLPIGYDGREALVAVLFPVIALIALDGCAEPIAPAPSSYLPYARWRGPLRPLAALAYPGWPSGLLAATVFASALAALQTWAVSLSLGEALVLAIAGLAVVAAPVGLARLVRRHTPLIIWAVAFHVVTVGAALVFGGVAEALDLDGGRDLYLCLSPLTAATALAADELRGHVPTALLANVAWLSLAAILIALRGVADLRAVNEMVGRAQASRPRGGGGA